jgi:hypothetical protein
LAVILGCISLVTTVTLGHGGLQHVIGTVKAVSANSITVQTAEAQPKIVTVVVLPTTKFQKSGMDSSLKDLRVNDRVVIHAKADGDKLDAVTVAFGKTPAHPEMPGHMPGIDKEQ